MNLYDVQMRTNSVTLRSLGARRCTQLSTREEPDVTTMTSSTPMVGDTMGESAPRF